MQISYRVLSQVPVQEYFQNEVAEYTMQRIYMLCNQKELVEVMELNVRQDHIHIVVSY